MPLVDLVTRRTRNALNKNVLGTARAVESWVLCPIGKLGGVSLTDDQAKSDC